MVITVLLLMMMLYIKRLGWGFADVCIHCTNDVTCIGSKS